MAAIFKPYRFTAADKALLDRDGHFVFPGLLSEPVREELELALRYMVEVVKSHGYEPHGPHMYAAEHAPYLATLIAHPQMLELARAVLGAEQGKPIRYDHCVALNRLANNPGMRWHAHEYSDDEPELGFVRVFFYVNGFEADDGGLKVVPGSHLFRDSKAEAPNDAELAAGWLEGKRHPLTAEPLRMEALSAPPGSVVLMWTHGLHGVTPRKPDSETRWAVVYAYRNPGRPSRARRISEAFEQSGLPGQEGLLSLY